MVLQPPGPGIPLPQPTPLSAPHWEGARRGELMVQRCRACGGHVFIPQPVCTHCFATDLEWVQSSGRGTVYSYTTVHRPQQPAYDVPYVAAIIELEEGWYMLSNVIGVEPSEVHVDMAVEVEFHEASGEITLPYFRPASAS
jgi:hypothetical protein